MGFPAFRNQDRRSSRFQLPPPSPSLLKESTQVECIPDKLNVCCCCCRRMKSPLPTWSNFSQLHTRHEKATDHSFIRRPVGCKKRLSSSVLLACCIKPVYLGVLFARAYLASKPTTSISNRWDEAPGRIGRIIRKPSKSLKPLSAHTSSRSRSKAI